MTAATQLCLLVVVPGLHGLNHRQHACHQRLHLVPVSRSEEHTSELQSLMRISYAVFCLKKNPPHTARVNGRAEQSLGPTTNLIPNPPNRAITIHRLAARNKKQK